MKKNILSGIFLFLFIACVQKLQAGDFFTEFYSEAVKANLTGLSTSAKLKIGIKEQKVDYYLYLFYEWADTTGTDLPFEYRYQGLT
ncbi:MAG: hypothetical protein QHH15_06150, partial [Candidatus Thermoplasmatota archaeon]|nr:hypothetical protein [Candidatus Thermoplasmatota archaeon]